MIEIQRILCPVDFSDCSRHAFDHAVALATWYDARVTMFHVCAPVPIFAYATGTPMMRSPLVSGEDQNEVRQAMERFASGAAAPVPIDIELGEGNAATEIVAKSQSARSDLIVLGTHGRTGFERLVLGSVTEKVLRKAGCPVLTVPPRLAASAAVPAVTFKRIVCAVDFSQCSLRALEYAMSIAQEADALLTVLHVVEPLPHVPADDDSPLLDIKTVKQYIAAAEEEGRALLARAIPDHVRAYCQVEEVQTVGTPYREILKLATEQAADLIVLGVHGRGVVDLMFFGSTAQHVVRQAACPVLTLRT